MNYIDKDIKDHEDYIEFTTFNKFNIKIFFTKKHYGSIPERSKEDVAKDFSLNKIMLSCYQTHSDNVVLVGEDTSVDHFPNTDGILTSSMLTAYLYSSMMKKLRFLEQCILVGRVHIKK